MVLQGFNLGVLVRRLQFHVIVVFVFVKLYFELLIKLVRLVDLELIVLDLFVEVAFHLREQLLLSLLLITRLDALFSLGDFATSS